MNTLFWVLAILSTFGYSLQWALNTKFARKGDGLSMAFYRSMSLGISMLPLLFFTTKENILLVANFQVELVLAAFSAAFSVWFVYTSFKFLPIGIVTSFRSTASVMTALISGWLFFSESLSFLTVVFIIVTILGGIILSINKVDFKHLENKGFIEGITLSILGGVLSAIGLVLMVKVSRELDPFVSGYFWELEIALALLFILFLRSKLSNKKIEIISKKDFLSILLASSPSLIGTGGFALASLYGPIGLISAIGVFGIVFSTIFGIILFKEKLKVVQYSGIAVVIIGILGIKLFG